MVRKIPALIVLILIWAVVSCSGTTPRSDDSWKGSRITGVITDPEGRPVEGGHVYAYGGSRANILGPADAMSEKTGADGVYHIYLPKGEYRLAARKRVSGAIGGPLRNGDMGGKKRETVAVYTDIVSGQDIVVRVFEQGREGDPAKILTTDTVLRGTVVDGAGNPLADAHVFAYLGGFRKDPPDFLSPLTGKDGRFTLHLPGDGEYTIGARTGSRGRPRDGDLIGFWGGSRTPRNVFGGKTVSNVKLVLKAYGDLDDGI